MQLSTQQSSKGKIIDLLRLRDLYLKKIEKESNSIVVYETVIGNGKQSSALVATPALFQSVYDLLQNTCIITSELRRANVATKTHMKDYFGNYMSVVECRQNTVGDKLVGIPSVHYHLKSLYNKMLTQTREINSIVKNHNDTHSLKLKKIQETEYNKHEDERKSFREQNIQLPNDFEIAYEAKLKNISDAFWLKNNASYFDPLNVFSLLENLSSWTDKFEQEKEMQLNRANNSETTLDFDLSQYQENEDAIKTVSLEELNNLIKNKNSEISKLINRLIVVSWRVGANDLANELVLSAKENYDLIMQMIKSYSLMQNAYRIVSTFVPTQFVNSLTKQKMSAVDAVDLKNIVVPIMTKMLNLVERQKKTTHSHVKDKEDSVRTEVVRLLEGSMNSANSRPSVEKIKEYTINLMESISPRILEAVGIEKYVTVYQQFLDEFDSQIKPALSTMNANTRVKIVWDVNNIPKMTGSWETINQMNTYTQSEIIESVSLYDLTDDDNCTTTDEYNPSTQQNHSSQRFASGHGRTNRGHGRTNRGSGRNTHNNFQSTGGWD